MTTLKPGDKVQMPGVPIVIEVLEVGTDPDCCDQEVFRFSDPGGLGDDWLHSADVVVVHRAEEQTGHGTSRVGDGND